MEDALVRRAMEDALRREGFEIQSEARSMASQIEPWVGSVRPDLVVLGFDHATNADGYAIAQAVRQCGTSPVLLIVSDESAVGRLAGFEAGAEDCLGSPFLMAELVARVHVVLRRSGRLICAVWHVADLVIDNRRREVVRGDRIIDLTKTEFDLLSFLAENDGQVLSKRQLLRQIWDCDYLSLNLVEVHICSLRRKLEIHGPRLVRTVRGVGYVLRA